MEFEKEIHADSVQLLDVRTFSEYKRGHISKALLADWNDRSEFQRRLSYLDKRKSVYVYCAVGGRSAAAAEWMRKEGFSRVVELDGGMVTWKKAGLPEEGTAQEKQLSLAEYLALIPSSGAVLVDFGAIWCPPCVQMEPILQEIESGGAGAVKLLRMDVGVHTDLLKELHIDSYPTFIIYKDGKQVWRQTGIVEKSVLLEELK